MMLIKDGVELDPLDLSSLPFYTFGRLPACDVVLDHPSISRFVQGSCHCIDASRCLKCYDYAAHYVRAGCTLSSSTAKVMVQPFVTTRAPPTASTSIKSAFPLKSLSDFGTDFTGQFGACDGKGALFDMSIFCHLAVSGMACDLGTAADATSSLDLKNHLLKLPRLSSAVLPR